MLNIIINLVKLSQKDAQEQKIAASALNDKEMTEAESLARDILAPLAVAELMKQEGVHDQRSHAHQLGEMFYNCAAVCSGACWFCGDALESQALTLADGFRVRAFGRIARGGCFILILENNEEKERAYLVRPEW